MSTRGAIALPAGDGWWGRYHHFDSYPTGLGRELFHLFHDTFDHDYREMATVLIEQHPAGWSSILSPSTAEGPFARTDFDQCGFADLDSPLQWRYPACYCHGSRSDPEGHLVCRCPNDPTGCAPAFIEWAYVLTPHGMSILTSSHPNPTLPPSHRHIAHVPWDQEEPNWNTIQKQSWHTPQADQS